MLWPLGIHITKNENRHPSNKLGGTHTLLALPAGDWYEADLRQYGTGGRDRGCLHEDGKYWVTFVKESLAGAVRGGQVGWM